MRISLGPSGSPEPSTLEGLGTVKKLGLQSMELSFTHGVRMGLDTAKQICEANKATQLKLSIHAPYHINLCSEDDKKRTASMQRILQTCERAHHIGATKVVFHAAYYGKMEKQGAFDEVRKAVENMKKIISKNNWNVELAPETSGRLSQFGSLREVLELAKKTECSFCIDIAHIYARNLGNIDYKNTFDMLEESGQKEIHFHFEGIEINKGGEGRHLVLEGNRPDFREFAIELLRRNINANIISESPEAWRDSLKMKRILESMGHRFQTE